MRSRIILIIIILLLLAGGAAGAYYFWQWRQVKNINNFQSCAKLYPILETYPEQCKTPDGRTFANSVLLDPTSSAATPPLSAISPTPTPRPSLSPAINSILLDVPFFAQAPFGEWENPIFQDGCEEAAAIMAWYWIGRQTITKEQAKEEIMAISDFEDKTYGHVPDRSAADTAHLIKEYTGYQNIRLRSAIGAKDIKEEILKGNLVIVPVNGQILKNPFYTAPGPEHHMVVVIGYDAQKDEFITNDIGTRHGAKYRYAASRLESALQDYPTGDHLPSLPGATAMIVVAPKQ